MRIMTVYNIKDSLSTCKHWKNKKMQVVTPELWHSCLIFSRDFNELINIYT